MRESLVRLTAAACFGIGLLCAAPQVSAGRSTPLTLKHSLPRQEAKRQKAGLPRFVVSNGLHICLHVDIDPALLKEASRRFARGGYTTGFAGRFQELLAIWNPDLTSDPYPILSLYSDSGSENPFCHKDRDIVVVLRYRFMPDGSPYRLEWEMRQGPREARGTATYDVWSEWNEGIRPKMIWSEQVLDDTEKHLRLICGMISGCFKGKEPH